MTYQSLAEILEMVSRTRDRLCQRVAGLSEAQEGFQPAAGGWSIAEIVEHLSIVEGQLLKLTHKLLEQAEASGARASADLRVSLEQVSGRGDEKFTAPERARPSGVRLQESLAKMQRTQETLLALRPRLEAADLSTVNFPHPAFGPLDLYQWLALIGLHEGRHLKQIEAVISSPGFPN